MCTKRVLGGSKSEEMRTVSVLCIPNLTLLFCVVYHGLVASYGSD